MRTLNAQDLNRRLLLRLARTLHVVQPENALIETMLSKDAYSMTVHNRFVEIFRGDMYKQVRGSRIIRFCYDFL